MSGWDRELRRCSEGHTTSVEERAARYESFDDADQGGGGSGGGDALMLYVGLTLGVALLGCAVLVWRQRGDQSPAAAVSRETAVSRPRRAQPGVQGTFS